MKVIKVTSKTAMIQELNNIEARIHQKLRLEFEELFVDELTDKQHIVLNFIEQKGGSSPIQIAQQLGITQSAVSQLLNTLEKKNGFAAALTRITGGNCMLNFLRRQKRTLRICER